MTTLSNTPGNQEKKDQSANEQPSQDTGKDNQNGAAGEDEQAEDVNPSDMDGKNDNSQDDKSGANEKEGKFREDD